MLLVRTPRSEHSSFHSNFAYDQGGAIHVAYSGNLRVDNSTFIQNEGSRGGVLAVELPSAASSPGEVTFTHVTMYDNRTRVGKPGLWIDFGIRHFNMRNSIIVGEYSNQCFGHINEYFGNLSDDKSCDTELRADPLLDEPEASARPKTTASPKQFLNVALIPV